MKTNDAERRSFIKKAAVGGLLSLSLPNIVLSAFAADKVKKIALNKGDVILFQGDSITDAGRTRTETSFNNVKALGSGYAFLAAADLLNNFPQKDLKIYNRGISGNKVYQLAERWDTDTIGLKPSVLSILVGVNDYWHMKNGNYSGTIKTYRDDFRALLERTKQKLPDLKLIIGEPYVLPGTSVDKSWFPAFHEYRYVARELADSFKATFIPYQTVYDEALKAAPASYWTPDGVHPSIAGARLMSVAWQEAIK
ncbi:SGNH/GDSL hydrolase family protein [Arcticibacter sp. MXS-1]|uniref:SGNH/GDSL hydrolase family protein n=1 Tax=Arcticibacter sp. MXS-1 TaxID=3341726 RepID=UPI0035A85902